LHNGRCRLHGGLSTGPKTPEGIERIRQAKTKHGRYSAAAKTARREARETLRKKKAAEIERVRQSRQAFRYLKALLEKTE
jgi:hypothetical protein